MSPDAAVRVTRDADLRPLNTFGVAARAPWYVEVGDTALLGDALSQTPLRGSTPLVLGGGSNILFVGDPEVPVLQLIGARIHVVEDDGRSVVLRADAGVNWHSLVMRSLERGLAGLENLALIPGTAGAAPIQNIGAYGVEVRERIEAVHAFAPSTGRYLRLANAECAFAYRDSLFKQSPDRFVVTAVDFRLVRASHVSLGYSGLSDELASMGIADPTPADVAHAVIAIRRRKLPDPAVIGNAGSFFKNPIVPEAQATALVQAHPTMPVFVAGDGKRKVSAAWLIDSLGFKGHREGDAGIAASHALVLVNHGSATGRELYDLARRIAEHVRDRYGIALEPEPRLIGASWPTG